MSSRRDINDTKRLVCAMLLPLGNVVVDFTDYEYGIPKLVHECLVVSTNSLDSDISKMIPYGS